MTVPDTRPSSELGESRNPGSLWFGRSWPWRDVTLSVLLLAAVVAAYLPVGTHPFFDPDDSLYVTRNVHVQAGLGWSTIVWAFRSHYINWHPLTWLSHALDYQLFGFNPAGHHWMNVLLHGLNAILLFWVLRKATNFTGRSFMVAALFALHPVNVEAVVWVAERKTILSTTFFLLAFLAYQWYAEKPRESRYWAVAALFVLALLAKPQVIAFPILLVLWDYWPLNRRLVPYGAAADALAVRGKAKEIVASVKEKISLFAFAGADALITLSAQGVTSSDSQIFPLTVRLENAIVCYVRYIGKAFWPVNLAPHYPHPGNSLKGWEIMGSLALLVAITALAFAQRQRPYLIVGWLWYLISLLPMIGVVQVGRQAMADRYAYQSYIGLFIMTCWGIVDLAERIHLPARALQTIAVVVLVASGVICRHQVNYWKNDLTIWSHCLKVTPDDEVSEYHMGLALSSDGRMNEAIPHLFKALSFAPNDPYINFGIGFYEQLNGKPREAIPYYEKAVSVPESHPELTRGTYLNMAAIYRSLGDVERARQCEREAGKYTARDPAFE